ARAVEEGPGPALAAHLAGCARCRADFEETLHVIGLLRGVDVPVPPPAHREELRASLLAVAGARPGPGARWGGRAAVWLGAAAGLLATAAAVALFARGRPAEVAPRARLALRPQPGADYTIASPPPWQVVRLREGTLGLDVDPLAPGERLRVVVG